MTYRRALLGRWSRRDWLAVLVVGVAVGFLVGTALVVTAAETQTTAIAGEYTTAGTVTTHDSVAAARRAAGPDATVIPYSVATGPEGQQHHVLARITGADGPTAALFDDASGATLAAIDEPAEHRLQASEGTVTVEVAPRGSDRLPADWYVAAPETVSELGASGAFVVRPARTVAPEQGVPLRNALTFFVFGSREILGTLWAVAGGSAVLIAVVVYSVTRMTVRDRREAIDVIRSTGGTAQSLLATFGARAAVLAGVGSALGYAIGVIAVNAALNVAVFFGLPTALDVAVTPQVVELVVPLCFGVVVVGGLSGVLATWPAVQRAPLERRSRGDRGEYGAVPAVFRPTILDWRALAPTAGTLSAFVVFVALVAAIGGVVGPLTATGAATVTEPGAAHPFASNVPERYADALRERGIDASAEILVLQTRDGQPFAVRGADYASFASVTDATLTEGRRPNSPDEAVIGADLAMTLGVEPGDTLTLSGHTQTKLSRVTVVDTFHAPGPYDDQMLVSLPTARHLSGKGAETVQFVRAERLPASASAQADTAVRVTDLQAPDRIPPNESFEARITVQNVRSDTASRTLTISFGDRTATRTVSLPGGETRTLAVQFSPAESGTHALEAGNLNRTVEVISPEALTIRALPTKAPPNASPQIRVRTPYGDPVENATVALDAPDRTRRTVGETNAEGIARLDLAETGEYTVILEKDGSEAKANVVVEPNATRNLVHRVDIRPSTPDTITTPTARVELTNPWAEPIVRTVAVTGPEREIERSVRLAPGETTTLDLSLPRQPPGTYEVTVATNASTESRTTYRVAGDERIAAAIASGGHTGTSGIGRAIETAFGNLRFVLAVVLALAAAMTVGGTTATFAQAIQARRRTIGVYRATGAGPIRIARLVLADALRIGVVATVVGLAIGLAALRGLAAFDQLTVFGVRLSPAPSLDLLGIIVAGALGTVLIGAGLAVFGLLVTSPYRLLTETGVRDPSREESHRQ
jgi:ABC-type lipoprotein release transport system permease subunit